MATGVTGTGWNSTQASNSSGVVGQGWESAPISNQADFTPAGFAQTYGSTINNIAGQLNVDPSIIAGQLGLETGYGKSVIPGTNNLGKHCMCLLNLFGYQLRLHPYHLWT